MGISGSDPSNPGAKMRNVVPALLIPKQHARSDQGAIRIRCTRTEDTEFFVEFAGDPFGGTPRPVALRGDFLRSCAAGVVKCQSYEALTCRRSELVLAGSFGAETMSVGIRWGADRYRPVCASSPEVGRAFRRVQAIIITACRRPR
jgi:hypothetical protein